MVRVFIPGVNPPNRIGMAVAGLDSGIPHRLEWNAKGERGAECPQIMHKDEDEHRPRTFLRPVIREDGHVYHAYRSLAESQGDAVEEQGKIPCLGTRISLSHL